MIAYFIRNMFDPTNTYHILLNKEKSHLQASTKYGAFDRIRHVQNEVLAERA